MNKVHKPKRYSHRTNAVRKACRSLRWAPVSLWQQVTRRPPNGPAHLIISLADHFEPSIVPDKPRAHASRSEQERRLEEWCREYPRLVRDWPDSDGRPFRHTYFYPAEQYNEDLLDQLAEHCRRGWGEIESHLHHGIDAPDSAENTRCQLIAFRDELVKRGCLSQLDGQGEPRYAFVHGNYTLANSGGGLACGVDSEMQILAETGCYADLTLPSAPSPAQVAKINSLYECGLPLNRRAPHRTGKNLELGRPPQIFPLMLQGPLLVVRKQEGLLPHIENAAVTTTNPPTLERLRLWRKAAITVRGRPEWLFIKLHCHGMDPGDREAMLGNAMRKFLRELASLSRNGGDQIHFVTAREMTNIVLAACDAREGNPSDYREYRLKQIGGDWIERSAAVRPAAEIAQEG